MRAATVLHAVRAPVRNVCARGSGHLHDHVRAGGAVVARTRAGRRAQRLTACARGACATGAQRQPQSARGACVTGAQRPPQRARGIRTGSRDPRRKISTGSHDPHTHPVLWPEICHTIISSDSIISTHKDERKVPLEYLIYTSCTDPIPQTAAVRTPRLHQPSAVYIRTCLTSLFKDYRHRV
ncbi:hypothetical protein F511_27105 [Dorcoceras hygrometricum]|uniref:Uncharacterized protein n=1 Tax=Dorcoceras hygrometricum TaxID=472368 RepID=A0A2Z7D8Z8_9LAMI|nr:hypothetical protein F511_27105 [Dorcoceras hygrometricum]